VRRATVVTALAIAALAVGGCEVNQQSQAFNGQLVRDVGSGSTALKKMEQLLASTGTTPIDTSTDATGLALLKGRVQGVTVAQIDAAAQAEAHGRQVFASRLDEMHGTQRSLQAAQVPASHQKGGSKDVKKFVGDWNAFLKANEQLLTSLLGVLGGGQRLLNSYDQVLVTGRHAVQTGDSAPLDRARRATLAEVDSLGQRVKTFSSASDSRINQAYKRLAGDEDPDTRALLSAVNKRYPQGYLAKKTGKG
jgi:hypothetical protein